MKGIDGLFLRTAVVYAIAGMALGIFMAISEDHSQMPTHAHMNLLGWVSMALYAAVYRLWPEAARSPLAPWHFWIANLGAVGGGSLQPASAERPSMDKHRATRAMVRLLEGGLSY